MRVFYITNLLVVVLCLLFFGCAKNDDNKSASDTQDKIPDGAGSNAFSLTVTNTNPGIGRIESSPQGIDCGDSCSKNYSQGTTVVLTAKADPGYDFDGWNGCDSNEGIHCTITMTEDKEILAGFSLEELFVALPTGTFRMGDIQGEGTNKESPVHSVTLQGFSIMKREVTALDYRSCVESGGCTYSGSGSNETYNVEGREDHPVNYVSWNDIQSYINWLNATSDRTHNLCTEAQWEYAARAGTETTWTCGNNAECLVDMAWFNENGSLSGTKAVKTKTPNAWGLYDMHGNVSEWVADWYDENYYSNSIATDPGGPPSGSLRGMRGGSFHYPSYQIRSAYRQGHSPGGRYAGFGFRLCAKSLSSDLTNFFTLSVSKTGNGKIDSSADGIDCGSDCSETYPLGKVVTLIAKPDSGLVTSSWTGCDSYNENICTVAVMGDQTVSASFDIPPPQVLLVVKDGGEGSIDSSFDGISCGADCSESYPLDRSVTLTQTPISGSDFIGWSGCDASNSTSCTLSMNVGRVVTANYRKGQTMISIAEGTFIMGDDDVDHFNASTGNGERNVSLSAFYIMERQTTASEYKACVDGGGCIHPGGTTTYGIAGKENYPMVEISWFQAEEFINWKNQNLTWTYNFCTEAQWEYVARAGTTTTWACGDNYVDCLSDYAWFAENYSSPIQEVKLKLPNAWGVYGMPGNVWEWVSDWYMWNYHQSSPLWNPIGPPTGTVRILRGGSANEGLTSRLASAYRHYTIPGSLSSNIGFRLCAVPKN